jgi:signal transduction histidine kinase
VAEPGGEGVAEAAAFDEADEEAAHAAAAADDAVVGAGVGCQGAGIDGGAGGDGGDARGEGFAGAQGEGHAFAGEGIAEAGGVADQGEAVDGDGAGALGQARGGHDGAQAYAAAAGGEARSGGEGSKEDLGRGPFREQRFRGVGDQEIQVHLAVAEGREADLAEAAHVHLDPVPVLHPVGPGDDGDPAAGGRGIQASEPADHAAAAVGADDEGGPEMVAAGQGEPPAGAIPVETGDPLAPADGHAGLRRGLLQGGVEPLAAHAQALGPERSPAEHRGEGQVPTAPGSGEDNAGQGMGTGIEDRLFRTRGGEHPAGAGAQVFATRPVVRHAAGLDQDDGTVRAVAGDQGGGDGAGGAAADDHDGVRIHAGDHDRSGGAANGTGVPLARDRRRQDAAMRRIHSFMAGGAALLVGATLWGFDDFLVGRWFPDGHWSHLTTEIAEVVILGPGFAILAFLVAERLRLQQERIALGRAQRFVALGRVAAAVAHEVRNPLHTLGMQIEDLRADGKLTGDEGERIGRSLRRIAAAVDQVYALATPAEPGEGRSVVATVAGEVAGRHAGTVVDPVDPGIAVACPPEALRIVLDNLVRNAIAAAGTATIAAVPSDPVLIVVRNPGRLPELPDDRDEALAVSRTPGGLGLGLFVARQLAGRSGGELALVQNGDQVEARLLLPRAAAP